MAPLEDDDDVLCSQTALGQSHDRDSHQHKRDDGMDMLLFGFRCVSENVMRIFSQNREAFDECATDMREFLAAECNYWMSLDRGTGQAERHTRSELHTIPEAVDEADEGNQNDRVDSGCLITLINDRMSSCANYLLPGYFEGSVIMRITTFQCVVYAYEIIAQPLSTEWASWLYQMGAAYGPSLVFDYEFWRLVTPVFLHASLGHLSCNALLQLRLGFRVERILGGFRFGVLYFGSAIMANFLSSTMDPWKLCVGASTSGFGIVGANIVLTFLRWDQLSKQNKGMAIVYAAVLGAAFIFTPVNVDFIGHLAGLVSGACLTVLLIPDRHRNDFCLTTGVDNMALKDHLSMMAIKEKVAAVALAFCAVEGALNWGSVTIIPPT